MGIDSFFGESQHDNTLERFNKRLKKCKTKEEERELEQNLLKPEKTPPYSGPKPPRHATNPLSIRTVKIVFPNDTSALLFKKWFPVSTHIEPSLSNVKLLTAFCEALENEEIFYDKKNNKVRASKE